MLRVSGSQLQTTIGLTTPDIKMRFAPTPTRSLPTLRIVDEERCLESTRRLEGCGMIPAHRPFARQPSAARPYQGKPELGTITSHN